MRPSLGLNLSYPNQEEADITPTGVVEVFGKIWYRDNNYRKHWGFSLVTGIDSDNGGGFGIGLRWNGFWAGLLRHADERPDAVYVGIDLAALLQSDAERESLAREFVADFLPDLQLPDSE